MVGATCVHCITLKKNSHKLILNSMHLKGSYIENNQVRFFTSVTNMDYPTI